jgi:hypothetical protein
VDVADSSDESRRADGGEPLATDFIIPLIACGLAIYYLATTTDLVWEAQAAGVFVGVPLLAMCAFHMARTALRIYAGRGSFSAGDLFANTLFNRQRLALAALVVAFIVAIEWTGTTLGLFLLIAASMMVLGVRNVKVLVAASGTTCAVVYVLLMYLLSSRLPQGPIEKLIAWLFGFEG